MMGHITLCASRIQCPERPLGSKREETRRPALIEGRSTKYLVCVLKSTSLTGADAVGAPLPPPCPRRSLAQDLCVGLARGHTGCAGEADNPGEPDLTVTRGKSRA